MNLKILYKGLFYAREWRSFNLKSIDLKIIRTMKLIIVILLISMTQVSAKVFSQEITLSMKNSTLENVLTEIRKQSGYKLLYNANVLNHATAVTLDLKKASIKESLDVALKDQKLEYIINDKAIIIRNKAQVASTIRPEIQQVVVRGIVTDRANAPLPGVTILEKGTQNGATTKVDGTFQINVSSASAQLIIRSVGFQEQEVSAQNGELTIILEDDFSDLEEVVVVGYGTQRKSDLTGAVVSLTEKNFTEGANSNALQLLNGKAAGVTISQTSSAPGASTKIQIRGAGSINSSNTTLVVVDGLPGVDPSDISPDDILSIEILKDASSAAIYGTRAANGVVLITTKKGSAGIPKLKYNSYFGLQSVAKKIDVLNGRQYMEVLNAIRQDEGKDLIYTQHQINQVGEGTFWQDEIFNKAASVQNHQISISGGNEKSDYYAGLNYFTQNGLVKHSDFNKINFRTNLNFKPREFLTFKLNTNFNRSNQDAILSANDVNEHAGPINSAIQFDPTLPNGLKENGRYYENDFISLDNPLALLNGIFDNQINNNFYGTFTTEVEPIKNLVGTVRVGGTIASSLTSNYRDRTTMNGLASGGAGSKNATDYSQWLAEFLVRYNKSFDNGHEFTVMGGTTFEEFLTQGVGAGAKGFLSDVTLSDLLQSGDKETFDINSTKDRNRLHGIIGRVNYGYKNKYLLTSSVRLDGTSRFSDAHKYAFFPSGALAWRISEESFIKDSESIFNDLKLRLGYGKLGNQGIGNYQTLQTLIAGGSAVFGNAIEQGVVLARIPNSNLKWETTEEVNLGIDFGILGNRLSGSIDYYVRNTKDQLFSKPLPSVVGFSSIFVNIGNVQNRGLDLLLNSRNITNENFQWESSLNFSLLKNEVKSLPDFIPQIISGNIGGFINNFTIVQEGSPMGSYYGYKVDGIFQKQEEVTGSAQPNAKPGHLKFNDQNNDKVINSEDRVILGNPFPDFTLGLNNRFVYKNFSLDVFLQWVEGVQTLDANVLESLYPTNEYRNRIAKFYLDRWTPENPTTSYPSGVNSSSYGGERAINSLTVQDASFIRLKTVNLSYSVPVKNSKVFSNAQFYIAGDNLFTLTDYEGYDPDASATGTESTSKVSYNSYPLSRTVRLGLSLTF